MVDPVAHHSHAPLSVDLGEHEKIGRAQAGTRYLDEVHVDERHIGRQKANPDGLRRVLVCRAMRTAGNDLTEEFRDYRPFDQKLPVVEARVGIRVHG